MNQNEIYHHGILGMRWGVRRYQNADGSLTAAGKKKYGTKTNFNRVQAAKKAASPAALKAKKDREKANARTAAEIAKYRKKAALDEENDKNKTEEKSANTKTNNKSVEDMSDDELRAKINRIKMENELSSLSQKQISKGEKFKEFMVKDVFKDTVLEAAKKAGKNYLIAKFQDMLGVDIKKDVGPVLRAFKDGLGSDAAEAAETLGKAIKNATENGSGETSEGGSKKDETDNNSSKETSKKDESDKKVYEGTVEGEGTSHYTEKEGPTVDGNFRDASPSSSATKKYAATGQNYASQFLLEDKRKK